MEHIPVLLSEVLQMFRDANQPVRSYFDGTFGRGGHARAVMQAFPDARVVAMDQDEQAIEYGQKEFAGQEDRIRFVRGNFAQFHELADPFTNAPLGAPPHAFDIMLVDLGVSSPQLDQAERGFSFYHDGPLDMRMDQSYPITAATIVNEWSEDELMDLFRDLGEIPRPGRVVRAIVQDRDEKPFQTTRDLAGLVERVEGWSRKGHHPATRFFLALRLQVNRELEVVQEGIPQLMQGLNEGGRLVVLTFHSLEDRIVKNIFKNSELGRPVNKKVLQPSWNEQKQNSRARSAKLRAFVRESEVDGEIEADFEVDIETGTIKGEFYES